MLIDQDLQLIDGMRRCQAAWTLQQHEIPARKLPRKLTEEELLRLRVFLNPDRQPTKTTLRKLGGNPIGTLPVDPKSLLAKMARAESARETRVVERQRVLQFLGGGRHGTSQREIAGQLVAAYEGLQKLLLHYPQQAPRAILESLGHVAQAAQRVINFRQA